MTARGPEDVLEFWFVAHGPDDWFAAKPEFDAELAAQFAATHAQVARGEAWTWRTTPRGRLAEIIVLDQFSRQLYRGSPQAFAQDSMALALAQEAVAGGHDEALDLDGRRFLLMPYMHSESLVVHEEAVRLFTALDHAESLNYELAHRDCLLRFGRYPRRNAALGRISTPEELEYIASGTAMF
ncbi:MAG TPA: DUF924 domain-containing protein [Alphaproteobacteria bacterium]|nr:DUF924 domain-containing protein [Alphaproteobacteria bacterium]